MAHPLQRIRQLSERLQLGHQQLEELQQRIVQRDGAACALQVTRAWGVPEQGQRGCFVLLGSAMPIWARWFKARFVFEQDDWMQDDWMIKT